MRWLGKPHPLSEPVQFFSLEGFSIASMLEGVDTSFIDVEINGYVVPKHMWKHVKPRSGTTVTVVAIPQSDGSGGGDNTGKMILGVIAIIALSVLTYGAAAGWFAVGGLFAAGSASASVLASGIGIAGQFLIRALITPAPTADKNSPSAAKLSSFTGTGNRPNPYGAVPIVLGQHVFFPPHAANPYTSTEMDEQYLHVLLDLGWGDILVDQIKVADTELVTFAGAEYEVGTAPDLYSDAVSEVSINRQMSAYMDSEQRNTAAECDEISIDLMFPQGFYGFDEKNDTYGGELYFQVFYRKVGTSTWRNASLDDPSMSAAVRIWGGYRFQVNSDMSRNPHMINIHWKAMNAAGVPERAQYEVVVTRGDPTVDIWTDVKWWYSPYESLKYMMSTFIWSTLRSKQYSVPSTVPTIKLALQLHATTELSGNLSQISCRVRQQIPVWNGLGWGTQYSSNPAWIFHWLLTTCPANPFRVSASRVDLPTITAWAAECDSKGYTFNKVYDSQTTLGDVLKSVAAAGRASVTIRDGLYSVVRDVQQAAPVQHFSPRNSSGFCGARVFSNPVHCLRVRFINPAAEWQQDEISVYDDGYDENTATKFETLDLVGVTDPHQAWMLGRYHLACLRLRPNDYTFKTDVEHLVCTRGDLIKFNHDVVKWGSACGRVKSLVGNTLVIDELNSDDLTVNTNYAIRIRSQTGTSITGTGVYSGSGTFTVTSMDGVHTGDLVLIGLPGNEAVDLIVTKIVPGVDLSATITAVDAAPGVYLADQVTYPGFVSQITSKIYEDPPPPPGLVVRYNPAPLPDPDGGTNDTIDGWVDPPNA